MKRSRCIAFDMAVVVAMGSLADRGVAQNAPALVRVEGVAYDSLANRPLPNAFVSIAGVGRSATSDDKGRFRMDSVPVGTHVLSMQHAAFDSLGLSGVSMRVAVQNGMSRVTLSVPSFATLWRAACGDVPAPSDSALVFGSVRDAATTTMVAKARVELSWVDFVGGGKSLTQIGQQKWKRSAESDARGEFALCGVPMNTSMELRATTDSSAPTQLPISATTARVVRRDVMLGARRDPTGTASGVVTNGAGLPIANAVVAIDTLPEVRTGEDGRFIVHRVPVGTRQLAIVAIGMQPHASSLDVHERDTTRVVVPLTSVQTLAEVNVRAKASTVAGMRELAYEEHKRLGLGDFRDSTVLQQAPTLKGALATIPGITVSGTPFNFRAVAGRCLLSAYLDGMPYPIESLGLIDTKTIAAMEVYRRPSIAPSDIPGGKGCKILLWSKAALGK